MVSKLLLLALPVEPLEFLRLVSESGLDLVSDSDLDSFCRARLARFKLPARYQRVDALPRNAAGKILKRTLRDEWVNSQSDAKEA